jgi:hypothetical protein
MKQRCLLLIAGLVAGMCVHAQTQAPAPQPSGWEAALNAVTEACKGETPRLCPGLSTDTAVACLQTNIDKLTPQLQGRRREAREICSHALASCTIAVGSLLLRARPRAPPVSSWRECSRGSESR